MATNASTQAYEFNALYVNFMTPNESEDDKADEYFDLVTENEDRRLTRSVEPILGNKSPVVKSSAISFIESSDHDEPDRSIQPGPIVRDNVQQQPYERDYNRLDEKIKELKETVKSKLVKRAYAPSLEHGDADATDDHTDCKLKVVEVGHQGVHVAHRKKYTKVQPFSFEERHNQLRREKEEKIQKILEEERKMHEFHANPAPNFIQNTTQSRVMSCTDPQGPHLNADDRIQKRKQHKCEEEKFPQFKARPATVLQKPAFEPKRADYPLTDVTGFHLNTEERAKKREEFNLLIKRKEAELEMFILQRKHEEEKRVAEEIRKLRKEAVHKANPVPVFKPVLPVLSRIPLTEPKTPDFASRKLVKKQSGV